MDKLGIESNVEINRCHRIPPCKTKTGQDQDSPHTNVCRFNKFKDQHCILDNVKKLKNIGIFFMRTFQRTPCNLERHSGSKFWNIRKQNKFACLSHRSTIVTITMVQDKH